MSSILADTMMPGGFVDAATLIPDLVTDIRYASSNNFVGRPIDGYQAARCVLTEAAALALAGVQDDVKQAGLRLKVFDGYRPLRAVAHFVRWAQDPGDLATKAAYYPDLDKPDLFRLGYLALHSSHCRGSTVDLTLTDAKTGADLPMGGPFDLFGAISNVDAPGIGAEARANRDRLRDAMMARGFRGFPMEWWHFTLEGEPYPATSFDFPIMPDCPIMP